MTRYLASMRYAPLVILVACSGGQHGGGRPYPEPSVTDVVARLAKAHDATKSFRAWTTMDFWMGNQRTKGDVLVMGKAGAFVRIAALSPAGGSTMAEMACDGAKFVSVNYQANCVLTGPCDRSSIAQFFRVELAPDDFLNLAVGTPPVIANATGTVTWDASRGLETVQLSGGGKSEKLAIDMRDGKLDVMSAEMIGADGKPEWSVTNSGFVDVGGHRVPGESRFKAPNQQQDLEVDWGKTENRAINVELDASKFQLAAPDGLPACGNNNQASQQATPPQPSSSQVTPPQPKSHP